MAKKKSPIDFGDNRVWSGDNESKRKANAVLEKMGMPSDYKLQYIAEKDMQGGVKKFFKEKKQRKKQENMWAIRDGGSDFNRTRRLEGIDKNGGYSSVQVGKKYFGETKKKTKRPTVKKK